MTLSSLGAFSISLTIAALALVLGPGEAQAAKIKCGSTLGPGGTYILDKDLVCPASVDKYGDGVLTVKEGATLDLNGHTVTCSNRGWGIRVSAATLTNGTVRGCATAVVAGSAVVKNMMLIDNFSGVISTGEQSGNGSLIEGNIARDGNFGFFIEESVNNALIDNQAINNANAGFHLSDSNLGSTLTGNVATGNGVGFRISTPSTMFGNSALDNIGVGFAVSGSVRLMQGNIAKRNGGPGYSLEELGRNNTQVTLNVAKANRGGGFLITPVGDCASCSLVVRANSASANSGIGFHVLPAYNPVGPTKTTISSNRAANNSGGDMADDDNCRSTTWFANVFTTANPSCIH